MSLRAVGERARATNGREGGAAWRSATGWLRYAATPSFALMALLAAGPGSGPAGLCSTGRGIAWLGSMTVMYALMSVVHAAPWLKLISGRGRAAH